MSKPKLTPEQETILRSQVFDAAHPGTLLHDFGVVLDYIGENGVKAGGKYNLLPIDAIHVLDARLARPLQLPLKRPQLRSHPYLQGLHLLLRASELGRIEGRGDKARLVIDKLVFQSWNRLNPTEQYFALLNAWLVESTPEMVAMPDRDETVLEGWWFGLTVAVTMKERKIDPTHLGWALSCQHQPYNSALAYLFGLVSFDKPVRADIGAVPVKAHFTPFGEALIRVLTKVRYTSYEDEATEESDEKEEEQAEEFEEQPGSNWLRSRMQPYFPTLREHLARTSLPPVQEGVYIYKVTLGQIWRRIAMRYDHTLHDLLRMILRSIRFDEDHLYEFTYRDTLGRKESVVHPGLDDGIPADSLELGEIPIQPGDSLALLYDYGDSWQFDVLFECIDPPGSIKRLPRVLESHGKAPVQYPDWD
jgi:hypothetical protein